MATSIDKKTFFYGIVIILLLVIIGMMVFNFVVMGKTETGIDGRTAILLEEGERARVLKEMRQFLVGIQAITEALASDDMETVAQAARSMGAEKAEAASMSMMAKLPIEFKKLGFGVHSDFDQMADDAAKLKDNQHTLTQLSAIMNKCVACHSAYQLKVSP